MCETARTVVWEGLEISPYSIGEDEFSFIKILKKQYFFVFKILNKRYFLYKIILKKRYLYYK